MRSGARSICRVCGRGADTTRLPQAARPLEVYRLVVAVVYLSERQGGFTLRQVAVHLGVSKSSHLRRAVDALVARNILDKTLIVHPLNNTNTWIYTRHQGRAVVEQSKRLAGWSAVAGWG